MAQNNESKTLIVNYLGLQIGGIEAWISSLIRYSVKKGYRVIWLTTPSCQRDSMYKDISEDSRIEKVYTKRGWRWNPHKKIKFNDDESITMLSFELIDFMRAEKIRAYTKNVKSFNHYYILPHFTGNAYYPERYFKSSFFNGIWHKRLKKYAKILVEQDCIRAFAEKHLDSFEKNYEVEIKDKATKRLKRINSTENFNEDLARKRAEERKNEFIITTCARFDFPHKGYMLGLVDEFKTLKEQYSQLKLVIVGYGDGEKQLKEKIQALPQNVSNDIILTGALPPDKLLEQFKKSHLNVGLAGALLEGAKCGLPSLLVRHYSESCETYGYVSDVQGSFLKLEPGEDIKSYIKYAIEASDDDYIEISKKDYTTICNLNESDPEYIYKQTNNDNKSTIRGLMKLQSRWLNLLCYIKKRFFKAKSYEEAEK